MDRGLARLCWWCPGLRLHTIQFNAMTESLKIIDARLQLDIEGMYICLDILSIPQQNTSQKTLAVKSLNTYPVGPMLRSLSRMIRSTKT